LTLPPLRDISCLKLQGETTDYLIAVKVLNENENHGRDSKDFKKRDAGPAQQI
jgi:hypothetical protein